MPRDGTKNLKPMNQRTKEEQKEIATAGGIASGEARRRKRTMKELFEMALERPPTKKSNLDELAKYYGLPQEEITSGMAVVYKSIERAEDGNMSAAEFVRDTSGNKLADKMEVEQTTKVSEKSSELLNLINARRESEKGS